MQNQSILFVLFNKKWETNSHESIIRKKMQREIWEPLQLPVKNVTLQLCGCYMYEITYDPLIELDEINRINLNRLMVGYSMTGLSYQTRLLLDLNYYDHNLLSIHTEDLRKIENQSKKAIIIDSHSIVHKTVIPKEEKKPIVKKEKSHPCSSLKKNKVEKVVEEEDDLWEDIEKDLEEEEEIDLEDEEEIDLEDEDLKDLDDEDLEDEDEEDEYDSYDEGEELVVVRPSRKQRYNLFPC